VRTLLVATLALLVWSHPAAGQNPGAPPALYKSGPDINEALDQAAAASASAGGWAVTVSPGVSVRRRSSAVAQYAIIHPFSVEIYRILEGSGTLVTGGVLEQPLAESTNPNLIRSEHGIAGGLVRQVHEGDILVLQPGTPHWFSAIDGDTLTYMESRIRITTHPVEFQPR